MFSVSLVDCITTWFESNPYIIVGHEIERITKERFDIRLRKTNELVATMVFNQSDDSDYGGSWFHIWAGAIYNEFPTILIGGGDIDGEMVTFDTGWDGTPDDNGGLSQIMLASNPQFFNWIRDWMKLIILKTRKKNGLDPI